jgi:hypothetical protein
MNFEALKETIIIHELVLRHEVPGILKYSLILALLLIAFIYVLIPNVFLHIKHLALIPIQRFQWQSEKYNENIIFRLSSFFFVTLIFSIAIYSYLPDIYWFNDLTDTMRFFIILGGIVSLFLAKLMLDYSYFQLHRAKQTFNLIIDYQYGINQLFAIIIGSLTLVDVYSYGLISKFYIVVLITLLIYLALRFIGTTVILINNFSYPILTVIVYLCTFEFISIMVFMKVFFDNI